LVGASFDHSKAFIIEDNYWKPIFTIKKAVVKPNYSVVFHRFKHEVYFYMYAILMFVTAILFIGVAVKYKGKTYIQGDTE